MDQKKRIIRERAKESRDKARLILRVTAIVDKIDSFKDHEWDNLVSAEVTLLDKVSEDLKRQFGIL